MKGPPDQWSRRSLLRSLGAVAAARPSPLRHVALAGLQRTTITVWTWQTTAEAQALVAVAESFNRSQNAVEVRVVQRPAVYSSLQLMTSLRGGVGPDVCIFGRAVLAERMAEGILEDLTPFLASATPAIDIDHDFHTCAASEVRVGGRIVGIPLDTEVRILLFNRTILAKEGLIGPEWDPASGAVTFDHLRDVSQRLDRRSQSGAYERAGFVPFLGEGSPYVYLHAWHAPYFDEDRCAFTLDRPEAGAAASWVHDVVQRADPPHLLHLVERPGVPATALGNPFVQGDVMFMVVRDWELGRIQRLAPAFDVGATLIPAPDASAGSVPWATGNAVSIMRGIQHPEEAFRFVAYLASAAAQGDYSTRTGRLPSRKNLPHGVMSALDRPRFVPELVVPAAVPSPHVPVATQFHDLVTATWSDMSFGHTDVDSGLTELQEQASDILFTSGLCP